MANSYTSRAGAVFPLEDIDLSSRPGSLAQYAALFAEAGETRSQNLDRWRHRDNPAGSSLLGVALDPGKQARWAALYAVMQVAFDVKGRAVRGAQSLDTMTGPQFRGHGLFPALARNVYATATEGGIGLVYGFPNADSAPGFFGKLGWAELGLAPFLVRPLRPRYFMERAGRLIGRRQPAIMEPESPVPLPSLNLPDGIRAIERFDAGVDALWKESIGQGGVGVRRDAVYLNWRLQSRPQGDYQVLGLQAEGRLRGVVAIKAARKHGGVVGYVMELMASDTSVARLLLRLANRTLAAAGVDAILAWSPAHAELYPAYRAEGYWPLPKRLRPIQLHVGVRAFDPALTEALGDYRRWWLSYLDSDTV